MDSIPTPTKEYIFDSRSLTDPSSTIFCAIQTASADGHSFIPYLYKMGVRHFIVERIPDGMTVNDANFETVENVREETERLAVAKRQNLNNVIGITGSAGKTEVKEMIYKALTKAGKRVTRSPRSWNSRLGVPMSLLEAHEDDFAVIIEAGIDTTGDMDTHAEIIRPKIGILTAITDEHDAGFASKEEKIREKIKLFRYSDTIIYDCSDKDVAEIIEKEYPDKQLIAAKGNKDIARKALELSGMTDPEIPDAGANRIEVRKGQNDSTILYDDFTHDIRSLRYALDFLHRRSKNGATTAIISDIFHGPEDNIREIYTLLGRYLEAFGVKRLIAIGPELKKFRSSLPYNINVENVENTGDFLTDYDISDFPSQTILIAGDGLNEIKKSFEQPRHDTVLEINLDALVHNFNYFRSKLKPSTAITAMVKASAYGMGAVEVAKTLQSQGASYLAVAVIDEGLELRRAGITMPIMVLNPVTNNYRALFRDNLEPSVFSVREFDILAEEARKYGVKSFNAHIKLDTGMHRVGFTEAEIPQLIERLRSAPEVRVASVFSHLATADCPDQAEYTAMQLRDFDRMSSYFPADALRHILNTAGILSWSEAQADMVRLGIGLYGISPTEPNPDLRPVASLKTTIISLKHWPAGTTVGYGRRGKTERDSVIATLPIGYADGIDRRMGCGATSFLVNGKMCPTIGNICMDQCMIDVTDVPGVAIGDTAEIFGIHIPIETIADSLGTIPYEVLTSVSPRVRRIYFRD